MLNRDELKRLWDNFSLLTVGEGKTPNFKWKIWQSEKQPFKDFLIQYEYKGGIKRKDGTELPATKDLGIITGYDGLEVVDVDLKVYATTKEKQDFWDSFLKLLRQRIYDFDSKIVIYKTQNAGYHLLYRCEEIAGNQALAKTSTSKALIETRGVGGYVFVYLDNKVSEGSYFDIKTISKEDRAILFEVSKSFGFVKDDVSQEIEKNVNSNKKSGRFNVSVWDDFDSKTNIFDLISDDFEIPRNAYQKNFYFVKRKGSDAYQSGKIYDNKLLYLHTTSTRYPAEKGLTATAVYAWKYHNGNYSEACKDLLKKGFGSFDTSVIKVKELEQEEIAKIDFPIEIFPEFYRNFIYELATKLDMPSDYTGTSLIWLLSVMVGNGFNVQIKNGYKEKAVIWAVLCGKAGVMKTPSANCIISPLNKLQDKLNREYRKHLAEYEEDLKNAKENKDDTSHLVKPVEKKIMVDDSTLEALINVHAKQPYSLAVFRDEISALFGDFNRYNKTSSDQATWLKTWSGVPVRVNRISRESDYVANPFIPILGGIQPEILDSFYTAENKANGFMDRLLISYSNREIPHFNNNEVDEEYFVTHSNIIETMYQFFQDFCEYDSYGDILPKTFNFSEGAKILYINTFNSMSDKQNSDEEDEFFKSLYPKLKSYVSRFALLLECFDLFFRVNQTGEIPDKLEVSCKSMNGAIKLYDYFIANNKKLRFESWQREKVEVKVDLRLSKRKQFEYFILSGEKISDVELAKKIQVSRQTIIRWRKEIK